jgi:hypothetical protein
MQPQGATLSELAQALKFVDFLYWLRWFLWWLRWGLSLRACGRSKR